MTFDILVINKNNKNKLLQILLSLIMNILPKKRWHVRTKDNIARVRKDEAEAKEVERIRLEKLAFAESEARINFLRSKSDSSNSKEPARDTSTTTNRQDTEREPLADSKHVDLFSDYHLFNKKKNDEHCKEKKEEQEKYEKQIGYLTYLGQDTNEALKLRSWYEVAPKRISFDEEQIAEKDIKAKIRNDPLTLINAFLPPEKEIKHTRTTIAIKTDEKERIQRSEEVETIQKKKKKKKDKKRKKEKKRKHTKKDIETIRKEEYIQKKEKLEKLRRERLKREEKERARQEELLAPPRPKTQELKAGPTPVGTPRVIQKYNSQFNPELAKQNMN